jgi:hypothetical protein
MAAYDGYEDEGADTQDPWAQQQQGYRPAPWSNDYDPGPNWNNGVAPGPPAPRYDYNNGSPVDQPLTPGHGWEWEGPQAPVWDMGNKQWNYGVWQERKGRGLGYTAPPADTGGGGGGGGSAAPPPASGAVPGLPASPRINVPGAQLPGDIAGLFTQQPTKTPIQGAYQDALLKYMGKAQETPSLTDSTLSPQVEVFRAAAQRGQERQRLVASERAAATGQSESGYLDNLINKGVQEQGFNTASFNANLLGGEMTKRREELQAALQLANATGNAEAARELQTRLAHASAAMQQQGLNLQGQLGQGDLALRLQQMLMGNDQFYDQLGVNTALTQEQLNQRAAEIVMRGL